MCERVCVSVCESVCVVLYFCFLEDPVCLEGCENGGKYFTQELFFFFPAPDVFVSAQSGNFLECEGSR